MTAFNDQPEEKADKPDMPWLDALPARDLASLATTVAKNQLPSRVTEGIGVGPAVVAAFTAYVNHTTNQSLATLTSTTAANYGISWKAFRSLLHQQYRPFDTGPDGGLHEGRKKRNPSPGVAQTTPSTGPSGPAPTAPAKKKPKDWDAFVAGAQAAAQEMSLALVKKLAAPLPVMRVKEGRDPDLLLFVTRPELIRLGAQCGYQTQQVATVQVNEDDVVRVVMLVDDVHAATTLKKRVGELTNAKVSVGTHASDSARGVMPKANQAEEMSTADEVSEISGGVLARNKTRLLKVKVNQTVTVAVYQKIGIVVVNSTTGDTDAGLVRRLDGLCPQFDTHVFTRDATGWHEPNSTNPTRKHPKNQKLLKAMFKAAGYGCRFATK